MSSSDQPGHGDFIIGSSDWRSTQNDDLWQGVNGVNNPCPIGYRLPTEAELNAERQSWVQPPISSANNSDGAFASPLKLPAGGRRISSGTIDVVGVFGFYWSSTIDSAGSRGLIFNNSIANVDGDVRASGRSVRCIKD